MRLFFILTILFVSQCFASTNTIRRKRNMSVVRNFMCGLLGLNCNLHRRRYILQRPTTANFYRVVNDDFYVQTVPDFTFREVMLRNYYESVPLYQVNGYMTDENDYIKTMKSPNKEKKPILVEKLSKERDGELSNVANGSNVMPYRPLYTQNRLNELNNTSSVNLPVAPNKIERPVVPLSNNTVMLLRPNTSEVHVSKYPLVRTSYNDSVLIKEKLSSLKTSTPVLSPMKDFVDPTTTTPVIQTTIPEVTENTKVKMNAPETLQKPIKFSEPVPLKYSYKNVLRTQPDKNTVETTSSSTTEAVSITNSVPFNISNSEFFKLPPIKNTDLLLPVNKELPKENNSENGLVKDKPTVDQSFTDKQDDLFKSKNSYGQRGDIPATFW